VTSGDLGVGTLTLINKRTLSSDFLTPKIPLNGIICYFEIFQFLSNFNFTAHFSQPSGPKTYQRTAGDNWMCILYRMTIQKSQTKLPGGSFAPAVSWINFRKIGKTEKCRRLILLPTPGK